MAMPEFVQLIEVGPRDGLQNIKNFLPTNDKINFINQLSTTGLSIIEITSFVSPSWIPQLSDHFKVYSGINKVPNVSYPVLIPNIRGLEDALTVNVHDIAIFISASESFSKKNINCSISESIDRAKELMTVAKKNNLKIRGYISCIAGCPYEGDVPISTVVRLAQELLSLGCDEISLGDTIGRATPNIIIKLIKCISEIVSLDKIAIHFHDTYGQALVNIYAALQLGISRIDCAIAGLGGCPYAKSATGNVATEDVLYMLNGLGIKTGVNLKKIISVSHSICKILKQPVISKVSLATNTIGKP